LVREEGMIVVERPAVPAGDYPTSSSYSRRTRERKRVLRKEQKQYLKPTAMTGQKYGRVIRGKNPLPRQKPFLNGANKS